MGRKLEFCRDKALHTAMESFWAQGYESTSMRDLASKLGLHLGSVYNALGDKEKVFEAALKLNIEEQVLPKLKALNDEPDALKALDKHLSHVVEECMKPEGSPGCFVMNSLLEITNINDNITKTLHGYMGLVEAAYFTCLERAKKAGQIPADRDTHKYSKFIIASIISMRAMAKLKQPASVIEDIRDCVFTALAA